MDQRYVLFEEWAGPRIYRIPFNQTARVINEYPDRKLQVFDTLMAAKHAALVIVDRTAQAPKRSFAAFLPHSNPQNVELRRTISELSEHTVKRL